MSIQPGNSTEIVRGNVSSALLGAAVLLGIGFYLRYIGLEGISSSSVYNFSVAGAVWTFLIGGFLMLGVSMLCLTGRPWALLVDSATTGLIGAALLACGATWLFHSDIQGIILVLVSLFDLNSAKGSWVGYRMASAASQFAADSAPFQDSGETDAPPVDPEAKAKAMERLMSTKQARPAVPAKVDLRPRNEPPPDGFLAELGRENEAKRD